MRMTLRERDREKERNKVIPNKRALVWQAYIVFLQK